MEAPQGGFFLSIREPYVKPAISIADQISLIQSRGLIVSDLTRAEHYLKFIGYYRLIGYARHFRDHNASDPESYLADTTFSDVINLYIFDRKVRLLLFDAIERIEVAVRATINNVGALQGGGAFWLTDANNFDYGAHEKIVHEIKTVVGDPTDTNHQHPFIGHFYRKYSDPYPPSWMLAECFSLGATSRVYKHMKGTLRIEISKQFNLQHDIMESWLHSISHCRNIVAHHSRCWKRTFTIRPKIPKKYRQDVPTASENKLYAHCLMLQHFLGVIADGSKWVERLATLTDECPKTTLADMGFPDDWKQTAFWSR